MKNSIDQTEKLDKKLTNMLLTPSWLSGLIAFASGMILTLGVIVASDIHNSQVQQQLVALQNTATPALTLPGEAAPSVGNNFLQTSWPLLVFWGFIGLAVYFVVEAVLGAVKNAADLRKELDYVNTQRDSLIRTIVQHLALRLTAMIVWFILLDIFLKRVIPYSITAAHASASNQFSVNAVLYAVLAFVMIALSMHLNTILLRLAMRRPRVFDRASYL